MLTLITTLLGVVFTKTFTILSILFKKYFPYDHKIRTEVLKQPTDYKDTLFTLSKLTPLRTTSK